MPSIDYFPNSDELNARQDSNQPIGRDTVPWLRDEAATRPRVVIDVTMFKLLQQRRSFIVSITE